MVSERERMRRQVGGPAGFAEKAKPPCPPGRRSTAASRGFGIDPPRPPPRTEASRSSALSSFSPLGPRRSVRNVVVSTRPHKEREAPGISESCSLPPSSRRASPSVGQLCPVLRAHTYATKSRTSHIYSIVLRFSHVSLFLSAIWIVFDIDTRTFTCGHKKRTH